MSDNSNGYNRIDISNVFSGGRMGLEEGESLTIGLNFKKEKINVINEIDQIEEYIDFKIASVLRLKEEEKISKSSLKLRLKRRINSFVAMRTQRNLVALSRVLDSLS